MPDPRLQALEQQILGTQAPNLPQVSPQRQQLAQILASAGDAISGTNFGQNLLNAKQLNLDQEKESALLDFKTRLALQRTQLETVRNSIKDKQEFLDFQDRQLTRASQRKGTAQSITESKARTEGIGLDTKLKKETFNTKVAKGQADLARTEADTRRLNAFADEIELKNAETGATVDSRINLKNMQASLKIKVLQDAEATLKNPIASPEEINQARRTILEGRVNPIGQIKNPDPTKILKTLQNTNKHLAAASVGDKTDPGTIQFQSDILQSEFNNLPRYAKDIEQEIRAVAGTKLKNDEGKWDIEIQQKMVEEAVNQLVVPGTVKQYKDDGIWVDFLNDIVSVAPDVVKEPEDFIIKLLEVINPSAAKRQKALRKPKPSFFSVDFKRKPSESQQFQRDLRQSQSTRGFN